MLYYSLYKNIVHIYKYRILYIINIYVIYLFVCVHIFILCVCGIYI